LTEEEIEEKRESVKIRYHSTLASLSEEQRKEYRAAKAEAARNSRAKLNREAPLVAKEKRAARNTTRREKYANLGEEEYAEYRSVANGHQRERRRRERERERQRI
jgi:hypothetical protein